MAEQPIPCYSHQDLCRAADTFLRKRHVSLEIPVPIEEIIDNQFKLDIIPFPGLQDSYDTVGFTTGDLTAIYVDEFVYKRRPARYRFTLAHEIGHVVLHADFYRSRSWHNLAEWKKEISSIPEDQYRFLEWHANAFSGLVLVPEALLAREIKRCEAIIKRHAPQALNEPAAYREFLEACLAKRFDVSVDVVARRINKRSDIHPSP